jgi:hypothetical protein
MFANISRHPSRVWPQEQVEAALALSKDGIVDIAFPYISPDMDENNVRKIARKLASTIDEKGVSAAMVQGEYSLTIFLSKLLAQKGIDVYVAALGPQFQKDGKRQRPFVRFRKIAEANNDRAEH